MKKLFVLTLVLASFYSCSKKETESAAESTVEKKQVPAIPENMLETKVKDISLQSKDDTISYALGVAWASNLGRAGIRNTSFAFYLGSHDYMVQNASFVTLPEAIQRVDSEAKFLQSEPQNMLSGDQKLKDIILQTKYDTLNYLWGFTWMRGAKDIGISKITPALMLGLLKGTEGDTSLFQYRKADKYLRGYVEQLREEKFGVIKRENEEWLAQNKTKKDVVTLPSGLQYKVIKEGNGKSPNGDDIIVCHYTGKLINNTKFESSYDDGQPLKAYPSGVIPGWREALPRMKVGSVWELYVPYQLGYGSGGVKDKVPPYATLIYEIELLDTGAQVQ
jgi:FKBP-type peptidyl-prolyl cis-trans isomerase FklB